MQGVSKKSCFATPPDPDPFKDGACEVFFFSFSNTVEYVKMIMAEVSLWVVMCFFFVLIVNVHQAFDRR